MNAVIFDKRQANSLVDMIMKLEDDDENKVICNLQSLENILSTLIQKKEINFENTDLCEDNNETMFKIWLRELYNNAKKRIIEFLSGNSEEVQNQALMTSMKFMEYEGRYLIDKDKDCFPKGYLENIVRELLSSEKDRKNAIAQFNGYLTYDDIKYFTMASIKGLIEDLLERKMEPSMVFLNNCFTLMKLINFNSSDDTDEIKHTLCMCENDKSITTIKLSEAKKRFRSMWLTFLKTELPIKLYRRVLLALDEKVIPFMDSPLLLTDFLMDSYNKGGVCSILALNGIFVLMLKYNLEFPDFYKNLYALFQTRVLYTKYRSRFFYLSNIFLTSSHLPEYLVAAFIKRLARLTLSAPIDCLLLLIPFIKNLLIRHRDLIKMINDQKCRTEFGNDPFIMSEDDPLKCNAINSSLWEIKDLQNHYHPDVALAAKFIDKPLPQVETDISNLLEITIDDMLIKESKRWKHVKEVPLNHKKNNFNHYKEFMGPYWIPHKSDY